MSTTTTTAPAVQISVGADTSTVTFGESKVEVSADGKKVTAYTSDGVETRTATNGAAASEGTLIQVSKDFNTVVLNGVTIECAADNHLVISAPGVVITKPGPSNDSKKPKTLEIGDVRDGWAYVGVDKDTGQNVFAKAHGVEKGKSSLTMKWNEAMDLAVRQNAHLGSDAELDLLQETLNKGLLKEAFDVSGSSPAGWVWGSRRGPDFPGNGARVQRLSDGGRGWGWQDYACSVVLFCAEPRP